MSDDLRKISQDEADESRMPLVEHLDHLRGGLIRSMIVITLGFIVAYSYAEIIMRFLEQPILRLLPSHEGLYYTGLTDKFMTYMKVSFLSSLLLVSPYLLYEVWRFVSPGLLRNEKRFVVPFLFLGSLSFFAGLAFAYYVVIPYGYEFLINFGSPEDKAMITLTAYFSLTLKLMLAMGIVFELPVVLVLLGKFGIIDGKFLARNRNYAFIICSIVAAVATPTPDVITMLLVLVPLYSLYEIGVVGVKIVNPGDAAEAD